MDKKSALIVKCFVVLIFISAIVTFCRYMIFKDYEVIPTENTATTPDAVGADLTATSTI